MVGNFVQIGPDGGRTEGTFYIQKPGRVRFAYNPPSPIDIIADGSSVVVRDRKLATQDLYPLSQTPLRYLLADRIDLLRDTDVVSVTADDTFTTVTIEEKQLVIGTSRLMMMFDAKDLTLKQWTVTDPQGFDTTVAVYNLDTAKKPDPNLFVINYDARQRRHQQSVSCGQRSDRIGWRMRRARYLYSAPHDYRLPITDPLHREAHRHNLEYQFGAAAHRSRRQIHQSGAARHSLPARDQVPGRRVSAQALQAARL